MELVKLLVEEGEIEINEYGINKFIHARGGIKLGYHIQNKNFSIEFSPSTNLTAPADSPTAVNGSSAGAIVRPFQMSLILSLGAYVLSNYMIRFL